jgi:hypothetical protein
MRELLVIAGAVSYDLKVENYKSATAIHHIKTKPTICNSKRATRVRGEEKSITKARWGNKYAKSRSLWRFCVSHRRVDERELLEND